jgi:tetratricopeptide (TPR) repeat protein
VRGLALVLGALAWSGLSGCAPPAKTGEQVQEDLATMKAERSADKLAARGRAFASVGDYTRAEQYLSAALDVGGDAPTLLPELLKVCITGRRYRVAIAYATPWLSRYPSDTKLRFVLAALRTSIGDAEGAKKDLQQIIATQPDDATAHFAYAVLLRDQLGDLADADREFREYLRLAPSGSHVDEARASLLKSVP